MRADRHRDRQTYTHTHADRQYFAPLTGTKQLLLLLTAAWLTAWNTVSDNNPVEVLA